MKNLITKKLALLAIVLFASIGNAFGQSITFDFNGINDNDYNADALIVNSGSWVSSNETINFSEGEDVTIKVFAYNIYELDKVYVDGEEIAVNIHAEHEFKSISGNHTVKVVCKKVPTNTVALSFNYQNVARLCFDGFNFSRCPQGDETFEVPTGSNLSLRLEPYTSAYPVSSIKVDGNDVTTAFMAGNYSLTNIASNHTVAVTFEKVASHTINVTLPDYTEKYYFEDVESGTNFGWNNSIELAAGKDVRLYFEPTTGYQVDNASIKKSDGSIVNAANDLNTNGYYEFKSLDADYEVSITTKIATQHTITIDFDNEKAGVYLNNYRSDPDHLISSDSATPNTTYEFNEGTSVRMKFWSNSWIYIFKSIKINGADVNPLYDDNIGYYYDFNNLSGDYSVVLTYEEMPSVTVNYDSSKGGVTLQNGEIDYYVSPNWTDCFPSGTTMRIIPYANDGYKVGSITVDGSAVTLMDGYYEFTLTDDCIVSVVFEEVAKHTISYTFNREDVASVYVSWGGNSRPVNCSSSMEITEGSDVSMWTDWIDNSYYIKSFTVNDNDVTELFKSGNYSLSNVTSDLSIYVELETIEPSYAMNVTFNHDGFGEVCFDDSHYNRCVNHAQTVDVAAGEDIWVNVNLFSLVHPLKSIKVDDTDVTNDVKQNGGYSIPNISSNHSVYVEFDELPYNTISVNWQEGDADVYFEEGNFTLRGQEAQIVSGHNAKMFITPTAGCAISNVSISDGSSTQDITDSFNPNGGYYEFTSVNVNYTVTVQFTEAETRTISLGFDSEKGSVKINDTWFGSTVCAYNVGSAIRLIASPRGDNKVSSICVNEEDVTEAYKANGYYDFVLNSNSVVTVDFVEATYYTISVTCDDTENGSYWISHEGKIVEGTDVDLIVGPNNGYMPKVTINGTEVGLTPEEGGYHYVINNLDADQTINVAFVWVDTKTIHVVINENETKEVFLSNNSRTTSSDFKLTTGSTVRLVAYPQLGYEVERISIDNENITESYIADGYYDLVVTECTITIDMKKKPVPQNVSFTLPDSGVGTFCCEFDLDFSSVRGIKAYVASGFNPNSGQLVLTKVDEVPAGTGVLIKGTANTYQIPTNSTYFCYANMLRGVVEDTYISYSQWYEGWNGYGQYANYILGTDGEFYKTTGEELPANSAYLMIPSKYVENNSLAKISTIFLDDEEDMNGIATGIGFIKAGEPKTITTNDDVYNLQGQKVNSKALKPGIYIKNGKKFMVK